MGGGCYNQSLRIPENSKITAKYVTLDDVASREGVWCEIDTIRFFRDMKVSDCIFKLQDLQFKIDDKFRIGEDGRLLEYINYLPMGPLSYDTSQLKADPLLTKSLNIGLFRVQISADKTQIIDHLDPCDIEKIYFEDRVVLMKQNDSLRRTHRRILYQFVENKSLHPKMFDYSKVQ